MKLRLTLDETKTPPVIHSEMSYDGSPWQETARCEEPKFNDEVNKKILYISSTLLPPAIRYLSPDHSLVLFERPPTYVTFQYTLAMQSDLKTNDNSARRVRLPLPWQRYVMLLGQNNNIANIFMYFAQQPIQNLFDDPLLIAPILNFYGRGRLCPANYASMPEYERTVSGAIDAAMDLIWNSGFNVDTVLAVKELANVRNPLNSFLGDFDKFYTWWSHQSLEDVLSWDFPCGYRSFMDLAQSSDLRYNYAGRTDDLVVSLAMSAQAVKMK